MSFNIVTVNNVRERFQSHARPTIWKDAEDKDWNNWIWQQQKRIKSMDQLEKVISVTQEERDAFAGSHEMFNMGITPYYASLMDPNDPNDPIRLQSVPKKGELNILPDRPRGPARRRARHAHSGHHASLSGSRALLHDAQLPGLLPSLHAQAQGLRSFVVRREQADRGLSRLHRSAQGNPRRRHLRRRSAFELGRSAGIHSVPSSRDGAHPGVPSRHAQPRHAPAAGDRRVRERCSRSTSPSSSTRTSITRASARARRSMRAPRSPTRAARSTTRWCCSRA